MRHWYVDPDHWGEGNGSDRLKAIELRITDRGGVRVQLDVMAVNERAIGFSETTGYERTETWYDERVGTRSHRYARTLDPAH